VLGASKNKLPEGTWKDSRKEKCLSERALAWVVPSKSSERERWQSQWTTASVTVKLKCFQNLQIKFNLALLRTQHLQKCGRVLLDWSKDTKGFRSVTIRLGNVVHSEMMKSLNTCWLWRVRTPVAAHRRWLFKDNAWDVSIHCLIQLLNSFKAPTWLSVVN